MLSPDESKLGKCNFFLGVQPPNLPFPWGQGPHLTQFVIGHRKCTVIDGMHAKFVERFKHRAPYKCDRRHTDDRSRCGEMGSKERFA